jgi:hypothetical protein
MIKIIFVFCVLMLTIRIAYSQSVAINNDGTLPQASAILDVKSTNKGMLVPRMTSAQRTGIVSPAPGLLVYDTDNSNFWFYNGVGWTQLTTNSSGPWVAVGNNIITTNSGGVGIGTINPVQELQVIGSGSFSSTLGVGTAFPAERLHVNGSALITGVLNPSNPLSIGNNTAIEGSLTVNNNKGVAYNPNSSANLKITPFTTANFHAILGPFGSAETAIALPAGFTSVPSVFVGSINGTGGTAGELNRVILVLWGCTTNACNAKIINTDNVSVDYNITWRCLAVGN